MELKRLRFSVCVLALYSTYGLLLPLAAQDNTVLVMNAAGATTASFGVAPSPGLESRTCVLPLALIPLSGRSCVPSDGHTVFLRSGETFRISSL